MIGGKETLNIKELSFTEPTQTDEIRFDPAKNLDHEQWGEMKIEVLNILQKEKGLELIYPSSPSLTNSSKQPQRRRF